MTFRGEMVVKGTIVSEWGDPVMANVDYSSLAIQEAATQGDLVVDDTLKGIVHRKAAQCGAPPISVVMRLLVNDDYPGGFTSLDFAVDPDRDVYWFTNRVGARVWVTRWRVLERLGRFLTAEDQRWSLQKIADPRWWWCVPLSVWAALLAAAAWSLMP